LPPNKVEWCYTVQICVCECMCTNKFVLWVYGGQEQVCVVHEQTWMELVYKFWVRARTDLNCDRVVIRNKFVLSTNTLEWGYCTNLCACTNKFVLWTWNGHEQVCVVHERTWMILVYKFVCVDTNKFVLWVCDVQGELVLSTNKFEWCYCTNLRVCTNKFVLWTCGGQE
jgi:hypothetical protein